MIEFKPRYFVLPAIALTVLAMLYAPADGGQAGACAVALRDPGMRASFAAFQHSQSADGGESLRHREQQAALIFRQSVKPQQGADRCVSW